MTWKKKMSKTTENQKDKPVVPNDSFHSLSLNEMKDYLTLEGFSLVETHIHAQNLSKIPRLLTKPFMLIAREMFFLRVEEFKEKSGEDFPFEAEVKKALTPRAFRSTNPVVSVRDPNFHSKTKAYLEGVSQDVLNVVIKDKDLRREKKTVEKIESDIQKQSLGYNWLVRQIDAQENVLKNPGRVKVKKSRLQKNDLMALLRENEELLKKAQSALEVINEFTIKPRKPVF